MIFTWSSTAIATIPDSPSLPNASKAAFPFFQPGTARETAIQTSIDAEHEAIFAAYQNGETEKAVQMMKTHLNDSHALLLKYSGPAAAYCASSGTHFISFISPSESIRIRSQTFCYQRQIMGNKSMAICSSLLNLFQKIHDFLLHQETSSALVASSQINSAGCRSSALAIQTLWHSPPLICDGYLAR